MHRIDITSALFVSVASASLFSPCGVHAQTFFGNHGLSVACGPNQSGPLALICGSERRAEAGSCTAICDQGQFHGSDSSVSWTRSVAPGLLEGVAHSEGHQFTAAPCGTGAGGNVSLTQDLRCNDLVFYRRDNPAEQGVIRDISLNAEFRGRTLTGPRCSPFVGSAAITIQASMSTGGVSGQLEGYSGTNTGALAGYPSDNSTVILTSPATILTSLNSPQSLTLRLLLQSISLLCESGDPTSTLVEADAALSWPRTGPVFNLPEGYTCDSPQMRIVDNHWVPPCRADLNCDGALNSGDFFDFLTAFFSGSPAADFNLDGQVSSQDFFDFLTAFFDGC